MFASISPSNIVLVRSACNRDRRRCFLGLLTLSTLLGGRLSPSLLRPLSIDVRLLIHLLDEDLSFVCRARGVGEDVFHHDRLVALT